jgi:DNA modification methylase
MRGKRLGGKSLAEVGYISFRSRAWWREAWRVLRPDGHLYVFALIKELPAWYAYAARRRRRPTDIIAWIQPNANGFQGTIRRKIGGRCLAWRPILHWAEGEKIPWPRVDDQAAWVDPNYYVGNGVQANMAEAMRWPNQLPVALLTWLLRPHREASVRPPRVLDLFAGTGATREAAWSLGLPVVSVDRSPEALTLVRRRSAQVEFPVARALRRRAVEIFHL